MRLLGISIFVVVGGCSVVTPPPLVPAHDISAVQPKGTITVSLALGYGGGVFINDGFGFALRVTTQASEQLEVGGDLTFAFTRPLRVRQGEQARREAIAEGRYDPQQGDVDNAPRFLLGVQLLGRYTLADADDIVSIPVGLGFGVADTKLRYLTAQLGARVASHGGQVDVYAQPTFALSIPLVSGPPIDHGKRPDLTYWFGLSAGLVVDSDGEFGASTDLTALFEGDAFLLFLSQAGTLRVDPDPASPAR